MTGESPTPPVSIVRLGPAAWARVWWLAPVLLLAALLKAWSFFCPDDLFIHLRFARNLAQLGEWSFNPGHPVAGATSPPWVLLLAGLHQLGLGGVPAAKALGALCALAVVLVGAWLVRSEVTRVVCCPGLANGAPGRAAGAVLLAGIAAGVMLASGHWLTLWSAAGMETPLVPLLLLAGWVALCPEPGSEPARLQRGSVVVGAMLLGVATWARPDAWPAAVVLLGAGLAGSWSSGRRRGMALLVFAGSAASWLVVSRVLLGTWLPITVAAKGVSTLAPRQVLSSILRGGALCASEAAPLLLLGLVAVLWEASVRARWRRWLPLLLAGATFPAGYVLNQALGGVEVMGRYLVPWFVLSTVAGAVALARWWSEARRRRWVLMAVALTVLQSLSVAWLHRDAVLRYHRYHSETLLVAGHWLAEHAARDDLVLAGDIGVVGFVGDVQVLDPAGIVNPEAPRWARSGRTWEEIVRQRPRFAINPAWYLGFDLSLLDARTRRVIFSHEHEGYRWRPGSGRFRVSLRELDWSRPGSAPSHGNDPVAAARAAQPP